MFRKVKKCKFEIENSKHKIFLTFSNFNKRFRGLQGTFVLNFANKSISILINSYATSDLLIYLHIKEEVELC